MLNVEHLLEEAKNNDLPINKKRAILREYLQIIILNGIYKSKFAKSFLFMGGTALRYFYNLPRFSEDLDFNTADLTHDEFKRVIDITRAELEREGFSVASDVQKRNNLFIANIIFKDVVEKYAITDNRKASLMVKVEINRPGWELMTESSVLSMYGYNFTAILMSRANLLSEKICALFSRRLGRDIYDTLFMLRRKFPFNENILKINHIKLPVKDAILEYLKEIGEKELKRLGAQLQPFLFKEEDIELVLKAPLYAERFLENHE